MSPRSRRRSSGGVGEEIRRRHSWLELLQTSGPFLTLPVAHRAFPNGLPPVARQHRAELRALVGAMLEDRGASRHTVIGGVLRDMLDWDGHLLLDAAVPDALAEVVVEHGLTLRPDFAFHADDQPADDDQAADEADEDGDGDEEPDDVTPVGPYRLLGMYAAWGAHPLARTTVAGWTASPSERLAVLLRARAVPVGLVTDGRWWALVWAPRGGTTGVAVWDASLFGEEPDSLRAFVALLHRARFLAVSRADTLPELLRESLERQEEVTETLGRQVREAVELLLGTLDRLDADSGGRVLTGVDDDELYAGVVTVMMRIVFVLFAEERRLLPSDDEVYLTGYGVGQLVDQLESQAQLAGEQTLEYRTGAWHRLLAVSRAVYGGVAHEDLRPPAYGGGLFDPDAHPWLEGRRRADPPGAARPPAVDDRTVLRVLRAVQYVHIGGERRRLTFRALDVEQIGYVYEGLLEMEVRTADQVVLGVVRPKDWPNGREPSEIPIGEAEAWLREVPPHLAPRLKARTGWTESRLEQALQRSLEEHERAAVARAVGSDRALLDAITPLAAVLRYDERGIPAITLPGRRYVAPSVRRAATGTHYTPRSLAEDIAGNALEPLVYRPGPLETRDRARWQLRPSSELLGLRVADIAMGSGAFLVAACRYLADRLVEAWEAEGREDALRALRARAGRALAADVEIEQVLLEARRLVAEQCLYGVDINPLAVEMAKLSLWLITMDRERPFGFLNDRFVCGDTLLGLVNIDQLETLHVDPAEGRRLHVGAFDFTAGWRPLLQRAADLRRRITAAPVVTIRDVEHKQRLLAEAQALTGRLDVVADAITATGLTTASSPRRKADAAFVQLAFRVGAAVDDGAEKLRVDAETDLQAGRPTGVEPRRTLHWPLAFPEALVDASDPGFDAIIGNPPFLGGKKISGRLGSDYLMWLQRWDGNALKGNVDLAARFVLRAQRQLSSRGQLGYIATNTLVQGDTLEVGLAQAEARGLTIRRGQSSHPWPSSSANLEIVDVWASRASVAPQGERWLDGEDVPAIGPDLEPIGRVAGRPHRLTENDDVAFQGSNVVGMGFTLTPDEAAELMARDPRNANALQPFVIGKDLNQRPDCSASRWIINFRNWPLERAEQYPDLIDIVRRLVKPKRDKLPNYKSRVRENWWRYEHQAPSLYTAIEGMDEVLALSLHGEAALPVRVPTGQVFSHATAVFALVSDAELAILSSSVHTIWLVRYTGTIGKTIRYAPSDVFLTLPRPETTAELEELGTRLDSERRELMLGRGWGLTTTYNHVHDPTDRDPAVKSLRDLHEEIDYAVLRSYGWDDLDPQVGHHPTKIGTRWTVSREDCSRRTTVGMPASRGETRTVGGRPYRPADGSGGT